MNDFLTYKPLGEVADIIDSAHRTPVYSESGYPMVRATDIRGGMLDLSETRRVEKQIFEEFSRNYRPSRGDILITRVGSYGMFSYVNTDDEFCLGQNTTAIKPRIDSRYLYFSLLSPGVKHQIEQSVVGTTQKTLSLGHIRKLKIPIFGAAETKFISETLSSLDDKIELNRRMNATLEAMARALFKAWFVDFEPVHANLENRPSTSASPEIAKLFPSNFENGIPKGWEEKPFTHFVDLINERVAPTPAKDEERYIALDDMPSRSIDLSKHRKGSDVNSSIIRFEQNDILFGSMRPYFHKVGVAPFPGITRTTTFVLRPKVSFCQSFALFHLFSDEVVEFSTTNSVGSTIPYVKWETLGGYKVAYPSHELLKAFNEIVWVLVQMILVNGRENNSLADLRDSLLPRLISGKLRVFEQFTEEIE